MQGKKDHEMTPEEDFLAMEETQMHGHNMFVGLCVELQMAYTQKASACQMRHEYQQAMYYKGKAQGIRDALKHYRELNK